MYAALNDADKLIYAIEVDRIEQFRCPKCLKEVKLIQKNDTAYFQHLNNKFNEINERDIHKCGKDILVRDFSELGYLDIKQEAFLSEIKQRPDIMLADNLVLEYQCAIIKTSKLKERIEGYNKLGIKSVWILGGSYLNNKILKKHLKFLSYDNNWGFYLIMLDSNKKVYQLFYQIRYVGLFNKIIYNKIEFRTDGIRELLKFKAEFKSYPLIRVDGYQINKIRNIRGVKVDKLKENFFNEHEKTVEEFLSSKILHCQKPIYSNHYWRIVCGEKPRNLEQPLLYKGMN